LAEKGREEKLLSQWEPGKKRKEKNPLTLRARGDQAHILSSTASKKRGKKKDIDFRNVREDSTSMRRAGSIVLVKGREGKKEKRQVPHLREREGDRKGAFSNRKWGRRRTAS